MRRVSVLLFAAVVALVGCGNGDDGATTETTTESSPSPETELTVVLDRGDGSSSDEWTLTCDPPGGTHPDPKAACDTLAELDLEVFEPMPPDQMCTMIYGGPQTAEVAGEWNGEPINAEFSRENGCEIRRWDEAAPVLGHEGGVDAASR